MVMISMAEEQSERILDESDPNAAEEDLYEAFIGSEAEKMAPKARGHYGFSPFAFLVAGPYYAYRKMYAASAVIVAAIVVANVILPMTGIPFLSLLGSFLKLVIPIAAAALFYQLYDAHIKRGVQRVSAEGDGERSLTARARAAGGTSPLAAVVCVAAIALLCALFSFGPRYVTASSAEYVGKRLDAAIEKHEGTRDVMRETAEKFDESYAWYYESMADDEERIVGELSRLKDELGRIDSSDAAAIRDISSRVDRLLEEQG